MRKLRMNKKGLSVIFGVLILIAIAVIAGIIIYMYTSGYLATMLGGGTTGQEKVSIESAGAFTNTTATYVKVSAMSTGGGTVKITSAILRDASGNAIGNPLTITPAWDLTSTLSTRDIAVTGMVSGNTYTLALVSQAGNQFVSPSFKAP